MKHETTKQRLQELASIKPIKEDYSTMTLKSNIDQNTTPMSKAAAEASAKKMAAETTLTARDAVKMLGTLNPNQMVKITIVK